MNPDEPQNVAFYATRGQRGLSPNGVHDYINSKSSQTGFNLAALTVHDNVVSGVASNWVKIGREDSVGGLVCGMKTTTSKKINPLISGYTNPGDLEDEARRRQDCVFKVDRSGVFLINFYGVGLSPVGDGGASQVVEYGFGINDNLPDSPYGRTIYFDLGAFSTPMSFSCSGVLYLKAGDVINIYDRILNRQVEGPVTEGVAYNSVYIDIVRQGERGI